MVMPIYLNTRSGNCPLHTFLFTQRSLHYSCLTTVTFGAIRCAIAPYLLTLGSSVFPLKIRGKRWASQAQRQPTLLKHSMGIWSHHGALFYERCQRINFTGVFMFTGVVMSRVKDLLLAITITYIAPMAYYQVGQNYS